MSRFDLTHATVATTARAADTGPVSMSTRSDPEIPNNTSPESYSFGEMLPAPTPFCGTDARIPTVEISSMEKIVARGYGSVMYTVVYGVPTCEHACEHTYHYIPKYTDSLY